MYQTGNLDEYFEIFSQNRGLKQYKETIMNDIQRDREERQQVIEVLQNMVDWMQEIDDIATPERIHALFYAIASIKTDLKYDLLYEGVDCNNCKNNWHRGDGSTYCATGDGMCHYECEEPTTKDYLGVDCISRSDVLKLMQDNWHTHNGNWAMEESMDDIRALPAVTPQEPKTGHWIESDYGNMITQHRWYCSECGGMHNDPESGEWREVFDFKYDYCPLCGADMREVEE